MVCPFSMANNPKSCHINCILLQKDGECLFKKFLEQNTAKKQDE